MDWVFVYSEAVGDAARFRSLENYSDDYEIYESRSLKDEFPEDAQIRMDPAHPNALELADVLYHKRQAYLIVSQRARDLLTASAVDNVEYLPLKVLNHKGKPVTGAYFVLNILTSVDCIDKEQSEFTWNDIDPELITTVQKLVLDPARLPKDVKIIRAKHLAPRMLMHRALVDRIQSARLTGLRFVEIEDFRA